MRGSATQHAIILIETHVLRHNTISVNRNFCPSIFHIHEDQNNYTGAIQNILDKEDRMWNVEL